MTREQILETMRQREPRQLFYTMQLGGNMRQLSKMQAEGLIRSQSRYGKGRQRDWYLTEEQHRADTCTYPGCDCGGQAGPDGTVRSKCSKATGATP